MSQEPITDETIDPGRTPITARCTKWCNARGHDSECKTFTIDDCMEPYRTKLLNYDRLEEELKAKNEMWDKLKAEIEVLIKSYEPLHGNEFQTGRHDGLIDARVLMIKLEALKSQKVI